METKVEARETKHSELTANDSWGEKKEKKEDDFVSRVIDLIKSTPGVLTTKDDIVRYNIPNNGHPGTFCIPYEVKTRSRRIVFYGSRSHSLSLEEISDRLPTILKDHSLDY
jgi:hypothetical protein